MKSYDPKNIEPTWQQKWHVDGLYNTSETSDKKKCYVLDMFPYPSGEGLHVGHPRGYIATDVYSRFKRMHGYNMLHPMGWDAFGLPAENFAIKNKVHPRIAVEKNIVRFKEQLSLLGPDYDWSREINTIDPEFYKWTQWMFLKMYEKGLAYESYEPINWCPTCKTGLANEDVEVDGTCERCGTLVEKKPMRQWVLRITDYADRLLADLNTLPKWPEGVKEAQRNWIGRKEGVTITHTVQDLSVKLEAFSAYPAWLFADTFLVIAPEHPMVKNLVEGTKYEKDVFTFIREVADIPEIERGAMHKEKKGIFTGRYAIDPINNGAKMPIWIANFAMMNFGTGIIRCSAHDVRDYAFAQKYNIPLKEVVDRIKNEPVNAHENAGRLKDSGLFSGKEINQKLVNDMVNWFIEQGYVKRTVTYRIKDWVFSRQRYWGEPIPMIHCEHCGVVPVPYDQLPVILPEVENYEPTGTGESPLATILDWVNTPCPICGGGAKRETNTMPQWAGSSWYYLRYVDPKNSNLPIDLVKEKKWLPVDVYVGGDHATRHLIYARFWHKFLFDIGSVSTLEPFPRLEFLGFILAPDGRKMSKRWGNVINPDEMIERFGADAFRLYEMFIGPFESTVPWSTDGVVGTRRFIEKVWRQQEKLQDTDISELDVFLHKTIKKVSDDIESFKFNTAVSSLMILVNEMDTLEKIGREQYKILLKLLAPFTPHVTEELYRDLFDRNNSLQQESWPIYDAQKTIEQEMEIVVQINGKTRALIIFPFDTPEEEIVKGVRAHESLQRHILGEPRKIIYIKNKLINFVV